MADALPGAGDEGLEASFEATPSDPFTTTLVVGAASDLGGAGVALPDPPVVVPAALRAPGGMYAFAPLTTAPYL